MAKQTIGIPRGTRDFLPNEMIGRNFIFNIIRSTFEQFGYLPIETPSMENLSTLMGKYGEEGDRLVFKVLNSGDFTPDIDLNESPTKIASRICEKGLRYDLTVPFARFVVQHQNELTFPFKRYQMQPVWRADRPQKGRYREFYQCDADIIGSNSLLNEVELIHMIDTVFQKLNMEVCVLFNNRKILSGIAQYIGYEDKIVDITVAIDKMEKIGLVKVCEELQEKGIEMSAIEKLKPILLLEGDNHTKINTLKEILKGIPEGEKGIEECISILSYIEDEHLTPHCEVNLDLTLARGLNYYTGSIFEVKSKQIPIGSITGGGRYDNLTGIFGLDNMSGVGISFGVERIFDIWRELNQNQTIQSPVTIFFVNFGVKEERYCLQALNLLRKNGIGAEIYPEAVKLQKQIKYADSKQIPFVVLAGEDEMTQQKFTVKDMKAHTQMSVSLDELLNLGKIK